MTCKDCIHYGICRLDVLFVETDEDENAIQAQNSTDVEICCRGFKDKSRMVELPVKVGQTVYRIWTCGKNGHSIANFKVIGIHNRGDGWYIIYEGKKKCYTAYFTDFGKSVFLTKSEAENALAKNHQK